MLTLERLSFLMKSMVCRIDYTFFPSFVEEYVDGSPSIIVDWTDEDGDRFGIAITEIVRVDDEGIIHVKDEDGEEFEIEIFERVKSFQ